MCLLYLYLIAKSKMHICSNDNETGLVYMIFWYLFHKMYIAVTIIDGKHSAYVSRKS